VGVQAICEFPREGIEFTPATFKGDPRTAILDWDR
jgi:hypothetical protein